MLRTTRPFELKFASDTKPGSFSGYGAVFDNIDDGGDMIVKGAFRDTLAEWKAKGTSGNVRFLFWKRVGGAVTLAEAIRKLKCST